MINWKVRLKNRAFWLSIVNIFSRVTIRVAVSMSVLASSRSPCKSCHAFSTPRSPRA